MAKVSFKGLDKVIANLAIEMKKTEGRTQAGVIIAAQWLRRESVKLAPADLGNLRNSVFVNWPRKGSTPSPNFRGGSAEKMDRGHRSELSESDSRLDGKMPSAEVGFSAVYAMTVHENPKAGRTGRPGAATVGEYKFLETPLKAGQKRILKIIQERAKIK